MLRVGDGFGIRWYGLAYVAAFIIGYFLYRHLSRKGYADIKPADVGDFITWWVVLGTLIGGRIGYMLFYNLGGFLQNPLSLFFVWEGGMSAHGGMIGLVVATWLYARTHGVAWLNVGDNLVVTAPVGLFLGRCANFINGELYGTPARVPWAVQFPKELLDAPALSAEVVARTSRIAPELNSPWAVIDAVRTNEGVREVLRETLTPRHPSQLYEAVLEGALLFAILWIARTRLRLPNGVLTGAFFIGYAILRSLAEIFREPDAPMTGFLTRGQLLSVFLLLIGFAFVAAGLLQRRQPVAFGGEREQKV